MVRVNNMSRIEKAIEKAVKLRDSKISDEPKSKGLIDKTDEYQSKTGIRKETISNLAEINIVSPYIITVNEPDSPISEEYRNLKSMIVRLTRQKGFQNTLMITSALSGEGKSITALNLAATLSQEYDYTVLLIDADIRRPFLHTYLNIKPEIGLSDCLIKGLDVGSALLKTNIGKLSFLPAGMNVENPAELLSSNKMKELLGEIKQRYSDRYIIIDTPPILPFAETRSISTAVDGVIFVVKEGMASLQSIRDALELLKNSNILGIVYNDVSIGSLDGHDYSYYGDRVYKYKTGI